MFGIHNYGPVALENATNLLSQLDLPITSENINRAHFLLGMARLAAHDYANGKRMSIDERNKLINSATVDMVFTIRDFIKQAKS